MDHEKAIADAAVQLREAIRAAEAAGYRVSFPTYALGTIAVSATKRVTVALVTDAPLAGAGEAAQLPPPDGSQALPPVIGRRSEPPDAA